MQLTFHGAAGTTTGSMHLISVKGKKILLDCGLCQGKRKEAFERNRNLPFDAAEIDACILSHAHVDHSGNLPTLVRGGFSGPIYTTSATIDLCEIMLKDSAYLQMKDVEYVNKKRKQQGRNPFEPLYVAEDVQKTLGLFSPVPYENPLEVVPGLKAIFHDAGHILGAATVELEITDGKKARRMLYTGDLGRKSMPILRDPTVVRGVDYLLTESTYGDRLHPPEDDVKNSLESLVAEVEKKHSRLLIPAFSVGRTQQLLYYLHELYREGRIGATPVYVDSPLSTKATKVYENHEECYDRNMLLHLLSNNNPFALENVRYVSETADSKALNDVDGPVIIISASGMCEGGRILHHLKNSVENEENTILIVGYQAENTLGRRLLHKQTPVKIFGEKYQLKADVRSIQALSAHADKNEMLDYFQQMGADVECAFVVHGEPDQQRPFAAELRRQGAKKVLIPEPGDSAEI